MTHIIRWKVKHADGKATERMARVDAENKADALKRFESCFGFMDNPYEIVYDIWVDSDSLNVMPELIDRYSDDSRQMARRVYNALNREDYWVVVRDGKWYIEANTYSRGCSKTQWKFLERELRKMFSLEPLFPCA